MTNSLREKIPGIAESSLTLFEGIKDGFPIFLGYFTTAIAFGLLTQTSGLSFVEGIMISITNFSGSGQFLMMNLFNGGAFFFEIVISVFFLNSRYIFMASSLYPRLLDRKSIMGRILCGFGTTDEVFAVAALKGEKLPFKYMAGLIFTSYLGWVGGTLSGILMGSFLPEVLQRAAVITVYAMFASLLGSEARKSYKALLVLLVTAGVNSLLILAFKLSAGVSFLISMILATLFGALIYSDEEVFS